MSPWCEDGDSGSDAEANGLMKGHFCIDHQEEFESEEVGGTAEEDDDDEMPPLIDGRKTFFGRRNFSGTKLQLRPKQKARRTAAKTSLAKNIGEEPATKPKSCREFKRTHLCLGPYTPEDWCRMP